MDKWNFIQFTRESRKYMKGSMNPIKMWLLMPVKYLKYRKLSRR